MFCAENKPCFILDFSVCRLSARHLTKVKHNFKRQMTWESMQCSEVCWKPQKFCQALRLTDCSFMLSWFVGDKMFSNSCLPLDKSFLKFIVHKIINCLESEGKEDYAVPLKQNGKYGHWLEQFESDTFYGINTNLASFRIISVQKKLPKRMRNLGRTTQSNANMAHRTSHNSLLCKAHPMSSSLFLCLLLFFLPLREREAWGDFRDIIFFSFLKGPDKKKERRWPLELWLTLFNECWALVLWCVLFT